LIFVRNNQELMHLDLSHTEMQESMLKPLIQAVSESNTLMAVHLCGNPGINHDVIKFSEETLKASHPQPNYLPGPPTKS
jgi:hypothetical protein